MLCYITKFIREYYREYVISQGECNWFITERVWPTNDHEESGFTSGVVKGRWSIYRDVRSTTWRMWPITDQCNISLGNVTYYKVIWSIRVRIRSTTWRVCSFARLCYMACDREKWVFRVVYDLPQEGVINCKVGGIYCNGILLPKGREWTIAGGYDPLHL